MNTDDFIGAAGKFPARIAIGRDVGIIGKMAWDQYRPRPIS
jgi:hypothetical protein